MSNKLIREWFQKNDGDGEFLCSHRSLPYSVISSICQRETIVYTTKPSVVIPVLQASPRSSEFGVVGRYGLPDDLDVEWLRRFIGHRTVFFLGDMDPVDILVFAWLNTVFCPNRVEYLGINDQLLRFLKLQSKTNLQIQCSTSELKSLKLLRRIVPNLAKAIGPKCQSILEQGKKIESDILLWHRRSAATYLSRMLLDKKRAGRGDKSN